MDDTSDEVRLQTTSQLLPKVYGNLRKIAGGMMAGEADGHSMQATALVHEACIRVLNPETKWYGPTHFSAVVVEAMRRILVESARRKKRLKRGGGMNRVRIDPGAIPDPNSDDEILALDDALDSLAAVNMKWAELVKLRYFLGMTIPEAARALGVSPRTADGWWASARDWLKKQMTLDIGIICPQVS